MLEGFVSCGRTTFSCLGDRVLLGEVIVNTLRTVHSNKRPNVINTNKVIVVNAFKINQVREVFSRKYFLSIPHPLNSTNVPRALYPRIVFAPETHANKSILEYPMP